MTNVERAKVRKIKNAIHDRSSSPSSVCTTYSTCSSNLGLGDLGFSSDDTPISLPLPSPPPKRQRLSFDRWLALQEENVENDMDMDIGIGSSTRSTRSQSHRRN
jgi:hypothetical protein